MIFQQLMCLKLLIKAKTLCETYPLIQCQNVSPLKRCYQVDPDRVTVSWFPYSRLIVRCNP